MSTDPENGSSSNRTLLVVGAVVGGTLLVTVLVCGGLFYLGLRAWNQAMQGVSSAMQQAQQMMADLQLAEVAAQRFLNDLGAGRVDQAYAATSKGFQGRQTKEEFRRFVDRNPVLKKQTSLSTFNTNAGPAVMTFQFNVSGPDGQLTCTLQLLKEDEQWKVEQFTVP